MHAPPQGHTPHPGAISVEDVELAFLDALQDPCAHHKPGGARAAQDGLRVGPRGNEGTHALQLLGKSRACFCVEGRFGTARMLYVHQCFNTAYCTAQPTVRHSPPAQPAVRCSLLLGGEQECIHHCNVTVKGILCAASERLVLDVCVCVRVCVCVCVCACMHCNTNQVSLCWLRGYRRSTWWPACCP